MTTNAVPHTLSTNAPAELRDIVGPVAIQSMLERLLLWGSLAAALLLALALFQWWRRRRRVDSVPAGPPPLAPHERARRRLEAALQLLSEPDRFCTEVSAALRVYLEERFGWNAPDRTTEEFLAELRHARQDDALSDPDAPSRAALQIDVLQEPLEDFLTRCDFVKFARYEPDESELRGLQRAALRVVDDTVPPPEPTGPRPDTVAARAQP